VAPVRLGCGSPGTVPGVRWPNLAAPIRLLLSSIIQPQVPPLRQPPRSCGVDREAQSRRCGYGSQSSAAFEARGRHFPTETDRIGTAVVDRRGEICIRLFSDLAFGACGVAPFLIAVPRVCYLKLFWPFYSRDTCSTPVKRELHAG